MAAVGAAGPGVTPPGRLRYRDTVELLLSPLARRHDDVAAKTVAALERLARAVSHCQWKQPQLAPLRAALLAELAGGPQEVRTLAQVLSVRRSTVSRALTQLRRSGLATPAAVPHDRRLRRWELTPAGRSAYAHSTAWTAPLMTAIQALPVRHREALLHSLLQLIASLVRAEVVAPTRLCLTCRYLQPPGDARGPYRCHLLQQPLPLPELRLDCPDHLPRAG